MNHPRRLSSRLLAPGLFLSIGASGQWLNYPASGVPRPKNGKVNLAAPAPHAPDGRPGLTGLWMHERTTPAEFKRILRDAFAGELAASPLGMEAGTQHKCALNILIGLQPCKSLFRPPGEAFLKKRLAARDVTSVCHGEYGWPVAGLLSEPMKIVQAPKETLVLYEIDNLRREVFTDGRPFPPSSTFRLASDIPSAVAKLCC